MTGLTIKNINGTNLVNVINTKNNTTLNQMTGSWVNNNNILSTDDKVICAFSSRTTAQQIITNMTPSTGIIATNKTANSNPIFAQI